ncbi:unnamed protein product [Ilex paraguariensis]|uniref:Uncharacterized protein n=1 Tax=Ilex paraguariensis TaxID=185542 RepID=A0ABC8UH66_9AQUA
MPKHRRNRAIPMAYAYRSHKSDGEGSSPLLSMIYYFFFLSNGIAAICRAYAHNDYYMVAFIVFVYLGSYLLDYCWSSFHRLPRHEKSLRKDLLKFAAWLLYSAIMFGFVYQFGQLFSRAAAMTLYVVSTLCSAVLFYVYMIYEEDDQNGRGSKRSNGEKFTFPPTHFDSILERV